MNARVCVCVIGIIGISMLLYYCCCIQVRRPIGTAFELGLPLFALIAILVIRSLLHIHSLFRQQFYWRAKRAYLVV